MRINNLSFFDPIVRVVTTSGTPVRLAPYQVATTIAFNNNGLTADTITDSGSGFLTAGFSVGDKLTISGSTSNDDSTFGFEIATVAAGTLTLTVAGKLTTEAAGATVTLDTLNGLVIPDGVEVTIRALPTNTGTICLGSTSAKALNTATGYFRHTRLLAEQSIKTQVKNLNGLWIDATVNGEGVEVLIER